MKINNFSKWENKKIKPYKPVKFSDDEESRPRSAPVYDPQSSPRAHIRVSSNKKTVSKTVSSSASPVTIRENYNTYSYDDNRNKYNYSSNEYSSDSNDSLYNNKSNFDVKNLDYRVIGDKIHLSFTIVTSDAEPQNYKLEIPQSGTGMATIRNMSINSNDSSTQLFRVRSFTEKPRYSDSDSTIENPKNFEFKLNLPVFQEKNTGKSYLNSYSRSNSMINISYRDNNNENLRHSIVVQPDENVINELQFFIKATRRYLYDLQSFPTGQIKELFKFSKERYKLIKNILQDAPYVNLEPIMNSTIFGPNKCYVFYEGLQNLSEAQKTLMEYDLFKKNNNINEFIFQKNRKQCQMEKEFLYKKLVVLKNNIKTENDRHILHELNKIYNNIRAVLKNN